MRAHGIQTQRAMTLVESVVCVVIVGSVMAAALQGLGIASSTAQSADDRHIASVLAADLLDEILSTQYDGAEDAAGVRVGIGRLLSLSVEPQTPENRQQFDDVSDYHGLLDAPPRLRDGTPIDGVSAWSRRVTVQWADPDQPNSVATAESGLKRIVVSVRRGNLPVLELTGLRSADWTAPPYSP